jgi:hypothetical protein
MTLRSSVVRKNGLDETPEALKLLVTTESHQGDWRADCPTVGLESAKKYSTVGFNYEYVASTGICRMCVAVGHLNMKLTYIEFKDSVHTAQ